MTEAQENVVRYRLERATEALHHARLLAAADGWGACVNRLYYACFYAISAVLFQRGFSSSKHTGIRSLFNQHLVKTGEISQELAEFYNNLFRSRQVADYTDFARFAEDQVRPWLDTAESFVERLRGLSAAADSDAAQPPEAEPEVDEVDTEATTDSPPPPVETPSETGQQQSESDDNQEPDLND